MRFTDRRTLKIDIVSLTERDRALFFQALDDIATTCEFTPEARKAIGASKSESPKSYTVFWEDALRSRRKSTVFVALSDGAKLNDDRIEILRQLAGQGWSATYLGRRGDKLVVVRESFLSGET